MKQESGAIVPHQVIQISAEPKEKSSTKNNCYVKAATVLGVIQIICGIVALVVFYNDNAFSFSKGIWTFTLFSFTGMLTICEAHSMNRWLMATSMVLSINSAVSAGFLLIYIGISHGFSYSFGYDFGFDSNMGSYSDEYSNYGGNNDNSNQSYDFRYMADVLKVVMAWTMLIASTASALLTAFTSLRPSSSGQSKLRESGGLVHYNSSHLDLTNHQDLHDSQMHSTNPTNLQDLPAAKLSSDDPPTYQEVIGLGGNC